jgi:hypothetical protein
MMPGVPVRVHDAYIAGRGTLQAAVFGLVSVVNVHDTPELARGLGGHPNPTINRHRKSRH